ncbi:hypothetical protein BBJ28_00012166 [Nothophytophthora sp. Chile5]|nr:hypothetical protein BBJ28_00012166 [Nothophytophthora sp. Chile5]
MSSIPPAAFGTVKPIASETTPAPSIKLPSAVSTRSVRYNTSARTLNSSRRSTVEVPTRRTSIRKSALVRNSRRLARQFYDWKTTHQYLGRYSIEKLLALEEYQRVTSPARVFAIIVLTPVPSLLIILLLAAIPLESPLQGIRGNATYFVQSSLSYAVMTFSLLLFIRCALGLPQRLYSHRDCVFISVLTAGTNELVMLGLSALWTFPVPFRDFLGIPSYSVLLSSFHALVLGTRLRHYYASMVKYLPLICAQSSTLFIFQGLAILFTSVPTVAQGAITVTSPLLRSVLKRLIWTFADCLDDISTDVTVCVVEIFGALFQNVCVQSTRSPVIWALTIVVDFVQAIMEVRMYLEHKFVVDGRQAAHTAMKIIEGSLYPSTVNASEVGTLAKVTPNDAALDISRKGSSILLSNAEAFPKAKKAQSFVRRKSRVAAILSADNMLDLGAVDPAPASPPSLPAAKSTRRVSIDDIDITHREHAKLLSQTLQLLFAAEVLVFAEFSEFACSVVYGLYTLVLYQMPYAKYNLSFIGLSETQFWGSLANTAVYAALEGFTMFFLYALARAKYGVSTFYQLAFVLEKYWMSVQGKLIGSLSLIFILNTVHHGASSASWPMWTETFANPSVCCMR